MIQSCRQCQTSFEITEDDLKFYDKVSPVFTGKKYSIPPPILCPECRQQRRLTWRNERTLYERRCSGSNRAIIGMYPPDTPFPVYDHPYFFSDQWSALTYGRDFDFSQPFFEQLYALQQLVPRILNYSVANENAEYGNLSSWNKNCYMLFEADNNRDCYYSEYSFRCVDSMDCSYAKESQVCYYCIDVLQGYNLFYSINCKNCSDSWFLAHCIGCKNCFGCVNLSNKQYYFQNEPLTKEEYENKIRAFSSTSYQAVRMAWQEFLEHITKFPHKHIHGTHNQAVSGDYLQHCYNTWHCFDSSNLRDCKYVYNTERVKDGYDIDVYGGVKGAEMVYECHSVGNGSYNVLFGTNVYENIYNSLYCDGCANSHDLFGCISLHHGSYCILNKQYSKEEYETLVPKIIEKMIKDGEWGIFLDPKLSPFGYNETVAQRYFPLTKEEALKKGFNWSDYIPPPPNVEKILTKEQMKKLPDNTKDIPDDILNWALTCEVTGKPFKIIKPELKFYREHNLPVPRRHPDQRYKDRMALRNPRKLWKRTCMKCNKEIQTTYSPERKEIVYCEACYLKEVY